ncbi:hypothetical protein HOM13_01745 [Candidatus Woesearchaeota archaeon]|jgi:hypothetical protein|nr:hypothetical protein [Candidatus Woesearchaeota archaeon]MBT6402031.1 hypothetical protein [Candidatus Woesearchaeota archaeon]
MVTKDGAFVNYKIIGVLVLTFILSAMTVSAAYVTVSSPSADSQYKTDLNIETTFNGEHALGANFSYKLSSDSSFTLANNHLANQSLNQTLWNYTFGSGNFSTDGNYTLNISIEVQNGTLYPSTVNITFDSTVPTASIQFTDENLLNLTSTLEVDFGGELRVNCTPDDSTGGINIAQSYIALQYPGISSYSDNISLTTNTSSQVLATIGETPLGFLGTYSVKCYVQDNAGNSLETILNFTTKSVILGGTSPFIDEDFVSPIAKKVIGKGTMEDYAGKYGSLPEDGEAWLIKKLGGVRLMLAEEEHEVKVEEIEEDSITLLISSEPFNVDISVNETIEVDVNADGMNDLEIYLHKIHQKAADLVFKEITTPVVAEGEVMESPVDESVGEIVEAPETNEGLGWIWTLIILIVVILILMILVHKFTGKGNSGSGDSPVKFTPRDLGTGKNASWGQKPSENSAKPFY